MILTEHGPSYSQSSSIRGSAHDHSRRIERHRPRIVVTRSPAGRRATTARRYAALYRQASDRLTTAQEDERARLARDLHDGVGQTLTAVVLTLDAAEASLRQARGTETSSIMTVGSSAEAAVGRARDLSIAAL